jgi:predicted glycosyltransferase involved in capsule biosynthesis
MSIPYDGRVFVCDKYLSDFFKQDPKIEILLKLAPALPLMYGFHSTGGAFLANRVKYLNAGGENENFHGWGPEDVERVKRLEVLNLPVHFADGPFFHLWHPRGKTSCYSDKSVETQNRREFIKTCRKSIMR